MLRTNNSNNTHHHPVSKKGLNGTGGGGGLKPPTTNDKPRSRTSSESKGVKPIIKKNGRPVNSDKTPVETNLQKHVNKPPFSVLSLFIAMGKISSLEQSQLIDYLNENIIGRQLIIDTPFGSKLKLYADYTASGQDLRFLNELVVKVEDYYANTHTEISATGAYMNTLLNQAEAEILRAMKGSEEDYFIVGGGTGSTHAIEMAQKYLGTYIPPATRKQIMNLFSENSTWESVKARLRSTKDLPLVIVTHYEHHSNEVTWRNQLCDVMECPPRLDGFSDLDRLEGILEKQRPLRKTIIGSMSAGSNVTGIKSDVEAMAVTLKKHGALAFFDYAAVGPYVPIDLSKKTTEGHLLIDGIYLSPHKFLGGVSTSGVLVFSRHCYQTSIEPSHGGGGTVDYVGRHGQIFTHDISHREKSGTPGILQEIKTGLVFQLKSMLQPLINEKERSHCHEFFKRAQTWTKWIKVLGPDNPDDRVCIISFLVYHNDGPRGRRYLHQNLVVKLLNDIFGIQGRSGCACAGPYGHYLFHIDDEESARLRFWIEPHPQFNDECQVMGLKLGWARINLHYTFTDYELDYLLSAIEFIGEHGYKFLPLYVFDPLSGTWQNIDKNFHTKRLSHFGIDSMFKDERKYLIGKDFQDEEKLRKERFQRQKEEACALLEKIPVSQEYDTLHEFPQAFFYAEKGNILHRDALEAKAKAYKQVYPD